MEEENKNQETNNESFSVVQIDKRITNIEKGIESIEKVASEALGSWFENKKQQVELEREKDILFDTQHQRVTNLVKILISGVFILTIIALLFKEYELVKWILSSSFAVGAGAGITNLIKKKS